MTERDLTEWAWTLLALVGAILGTVALVEALEDTRALGTLGQNGRLLLVARSYVRSAVLRLIAQLGFLVLGVVAILAPNTDVGAEQVRPITTLAIFAALLLITANIGLDLWDRRSLSG